MVFWFPGQVPQVSIRNRLQNDKYNKKLVCILNLKQFAHQFNFDYYV